MPALWRFTRTETARRVYETLKRHGVTATQMEEYVVESSNADQSREPPVDIDIRVLGPPTARTHTETHTAFSELRDDERAVCAFAGDQLVGYLFLGAPNLTYHIHPLESDVEFDGGYIRRVFVAPEARNRGIATALISRAVSESERRGARSVHALIARDNRPSQWAFEACGFSPVRVRSYYRIGSWRRRTVAEA
jgi:ribosomal protein S18 acetylase RimI-like enzyme